MLTPSLSPLLRYYKESEISPGSRNSYTALALPSQSAVAPWEEDDSPVGAAPRSWNAQPVQSPWPTGGAVPASALDEHLRHDPDNDDPLQTRSRDAMTSSGTFPDDRRPSATSFMTASSRGSNASQSQIYTSQKKLQGFFGVDPNAPDSRQQSVSSFPAMTPDGEDASASSRPSFLRGRSFFNENNKASRPVSPTGAKPKTPPPVSSEVTPWLFQDRQVSHCVLLSSVEVGDFFVLSRAAPAISSAAASVTCDRSRHLTYTIHNRISRTLGTRLSEKIS